MATKKNITFANVPKGHIVLLGFYDGTPMEAQFSTGERYKEFATSMKKAGRHQITELLTKFKTEKAVGDFLIGQMIHLHNKLLAVADHVSDETLQQAWGDDWKDKQAIWLINISSLLYLKRIPNDNEYGWLLIR